jgi:hypothetical protein
MCVDCVLASPRIAQVDPGDGPLASGSVTIYRARCSNCTMFPPIPIREMFEGINRSLCQQVSPIRVIHAASNHVLDHPNHMIRQLTIRLEDTRQLFRTTSYIKD